MANGSLFDALVQEADTPLTFIVDEDAVHFLHEEAARLSMNAGSDARVVTGVEKLSAPSPTVDLCRDLAAMRKSVIVAAIRDRDLDDEPGIAFLDVPADSPMGDERFLLLQSRVVTLTFLAQRIPTTPTTDPDAIAPLARYRGFLSFDPLVALQASAALSAFLPDLSAMGEPPTPESFQPELLTGFTAHVLQRMEDQKNAIAGLLEQVESAATEAEAEAWRDPQSWVATRGYFIDRLDEQTKKALRTSGKLCMLTMCMRGLDAERQVSSLRVLGSKVSQFVRGTDFVGHLGNGVLGIGAPGIDLVGGEIFAKRLIASLRDFTAPEGEEPFRPTVTVCQFLGGGVRSGEAFTKQAEDLHKQAVAEAAEMKLDERPVAPTGV